MHTGASITPVRSVSTPISITLQDIVSPASTTYNYRVLNVYTKNEPFCWKNTPCQYDTDGRKQEAHLGLQILNTVFCLACIGIASGNIQSAKDIARAEQEAHHGTGLEIVTVDITIQKTFIWTFVQSIINIFYMIYAINRERHIMYVDETESNQYIAQDTQVPINSIHIRLILSRVITAFTYLEYYIFISDILLFLYISTVSYGDYSAAIVFAYLMLLAFSGHIMFWITLYEMRKYHAETLEQKNIYLVRDLMITFILGLVLCVDNIFLGSGITA